ncbi:MAG: hypothetical protein HKN43_05410 [Rhodothermales bacterium]|nr:hypothetical protein [Rhodothermales bacterium]
MIVNRFLAAAFLTAIVISGCSSFGDPDRADLAALEAEILAMIGTAEASDIAFCREIAFGSKPCGGPWKYLAYSTAVTDSIALADKVDRYNRWENDLNQRDGAISDCQFVTPPGVEIESGRCQLGRE